MALEKERLVVVEDYASSPAMIPALVAEGIRAAMASPIRLEGKVAGSLNVGLRRAGRSFTRNEQAALQAFAEYAGLLIADSRKAVAMAEQAELTRLLQSVAVAARSHRGPVALRRRNSRFFQMPHRSGAEARGKESERAPQMRYGFWPGSGSGVGWGVVALLLGLIGLAFPLLLVIFALALTVRAILWVRRTDGKGTVGTTG